MGGGKINFTSWSRGWEGGSWFPFPFLPPLPETERHLLGLWGESLALQLLEAPMGEADEPQLSHSWPADRSRRSSQQGPGRGMPGGGGAHTGTESGKAPVGVWPPVPQRFSQHAPPFHSPRGRAVCGGREGPAFSGLEPQTGGRFREACLPGL